MDICFSKDTVKSFVCFCLLFSAVCLRASAQKTADTAGKVPIEILPGNGTLFQAMQTDSGTIDKLIGNVSLKQGETLMNCDSAYINLGRNNMQAFGNVRLTQPGGTEVQSDYLRYTGNTRDAYLKGNVSLTDGKNNLWTEELLYNLNTKIGVYTLGGTLQSEATTLSSNAGNYNVKTKDARFTGEVFVTDPQYNVTSEDLGYNTETRVVIFYGPSVIINDKSELRTSKGTWDAKNELAHLVSRSSMRNEDQYIEADRMDYDRKTGFGIAVDNVYALDTERHITLFCGYAAYNELSKKLLAAIKPVLKKVNGADSIYLRADTFYSAPVTDTVSRGSRDTVILAIGEGIREIKDTIRRDTVAADTTVRRYFIGYHHVLVYSDSLQARCDSISYSQADSTMRMMYDPVAWSRSSQVTGDTILLFIDSNRLKKLFVPNNALIVSQSGPDRAGMFDQVQGKTLTGYFEDNAIRKMVVWPSAEAIYFSKDETDAYLGANQAQSERISVYFDAKDISRIVLEQEVKQTMTPMGQVNIAALRLNRFKWLPEKRPKSVQELFLYEPEGLPATEQSETQPPEPPSKETKTKKGKKGGRKRK